MKSIKDIFVEPYVKDTFNFSYTINTLRLLNMRLEDVEALSEGICLNPREFDAYATLSNVKQYSRFTSDNEEIDYKELIDYHVKEIRVAKVVPSKNKDLKPKIYVNVLMESDQIIKCYEPLKFMEEESKYTGDFYMPLFGYDFISLLSWASVTVPIKITIPSSVLAKKDQIKLELLGFDKDKIYDDNYDYDNYDDNNKRSIDFKLNDKVVKLTYLAFDGIDAYFFKQPWGYFDIKSTYEFYKHPLGFREYKIENCNGEYILTLVLDALITADFTDNGCWFVGDAPTLPNFCTKNSEKINPSINWGKIFKFIDKVNDGYYDNEIEEEEETISELENFEDVQFICKKCPDLCSVHFKDLIFGEDEETLFTHADVEEEVFAFSLNGFLDVDSVKELKWHRTESDVESISFDIICKKDSIEKENMSVNQTNHEYEYYDVVKALDLGSKSFVFIRGGDTPYVQNDAAKSCKCADIYFPEKNRQYTYGIKVKDLKVGDKVRVDGAMAGYIGVVRELRSFCKIKASVLKYVLEIVK